MIKSHDIIRKEKRNNIKNLTLLKQKKLGNNIFTIITSIHLSSAFVYTYYALVGPGNEKMNDMVSCPELPTV